MSSITKTGWHIVSIRSRKWLSCIQELKSNCTFIHKLQFKWCTLCPCFIVVCVIQSCLFDYVHNAFIFNGAGHFSCTLNWEKFKTVVKNLSENLESFARCWSISHGAVMFSFLCSATSPVCNTCGTSAYKHDSGLELSVSLDETQCSYCISQQKHPNGSDSHQISTS